MAKVRKRRKKTPGLIVLVSVAIVAAYVVALLLK